MFQWNMMHFKYFLLHVSMKYDANSKWHVIKMHSEYKTAAFFQKYTVSQHHNLRQIHHPFCCYCVKVRKNSVYFFWEKKLCIVSFNARLVKNSFKMVLLLLFYLYIDLTLRRFSILTPHKLFAKLFWPIAKTDPQQKTLWR